MTKQKSQAGFSAIYALISVVLVAAIATAGFYAYQAHTKSISSAASPTPKTQTPAPTPTPNPYAGWKTYHFKMANVSFKYPADWKVTVTPCVNEETQKDAECVGADAPDKTIGLGFTYNANGHNRFAQDIKKVVPLHVVGHANLALVANADVYGDVPDIVMSYDVVSSEAQVGETSSDFCACFKSPLNDGYYMSASAGSDTLSQHPATSANPFNTMKISDFEALPGYPSMLLVINSLAFGG